MIQFVTHKIDTAIQLIADRAAQNLEIISQNFQSSTKCSRILMGFILSTVYYLVKL